MFLCSKITQDDIHTVNELIMRSTPLPSSGSEVSLNDKDKESPEECAAERAIQQTTPGSQSKKKKARDYKRRITSALNLRKARSDSHVVKRKQSAESA